MRRWSNSSIPLGLALGIVTASVVLALGGCAGAPRANSATPATSPGPSHGISANFAEFSEDERERILAVQEIVARAASEHAVDADLLNAIIWVESRFNPRAKSPAGARGLMQLMPSTAAYLAKRLGVHAARAYDPEFNVRAGALYLAEMIEKFGDEGHAVAAYHAGPGNVRRWVENGERFPDYSQTYVAKVMEARMRFHGVEEHGARSGVRTVVAPTPAKADPAEPLEVPDVDSLPDAADIHGVPRVIYENAKPEAEPEPRPEESYEPVFIPHPELDHGPREAPPGWNISPREPEPRPRRNPRPRPKPRAKPQPAPEPDPARPDPAKPETIGIGVLPDV